MLIDLNCRLMIYFAKLHETINRVPFTVLL